ncbi:hypothetical protein [Alteromonas antoniana]|uniref:hypothetical protein n=1 Tax=Alteromonas antoniana TaxID=2803813 RepID=UPI001C43AF51|nr:hypothetical protein [Alteromonas antoniana]
MEQLEDVWPVAALSIDGVTSFSRMGDTPGLASFAAFYVNGLCEMLQLDHYFIGDVSNDGTLAAEVKDDKKRVLLTLMARHLATKGELCDGFLDMTPLTDEWLASLKNLEPDQTLSLSESPRTIIHFDVLSKIIPTGLEGIADELVYDNPAFDRAAEVSKP